MELNYGSTALGDVIADESVYVDNAFRQDDDTALPTSPIQTPEEATPITVNEAGEPTYAEAFPPLGGPSTPTNGVPMIQKSTSFKPPMKKNTPKQPTLAVKLTTTTQVFRVPFEERKFKSVALAGDRQSSIIRDVMDRTKTSIEVTVTKDQSLNIMVSGKRDAVAQARRIVLGQLQSQASIEMQIPKDHHGVILGKGGKRLQEMELLTATKITIPKDSDIIRIVGTKEGIDKARHELQLMSDQQAKLAFERLNIPKVYHPFICGPNNETSKEIARVTGARVNIPPASISNSELTIAGEKEGVLAAVKEIKRIYKEMEQNSSTVSIVVKKSQHKYIFGPRGQGIQEILAETGVSVEMPPLDSNDDTITLRGESDKLGLAVTQVYAKANSVVSSELTAPRWLHRFIIGKKGQNIKDLTQDSPKVHVEFHEDSDLIVLEGPPNEVKTVRKALDTYISDLIKNMDFTELKVNQKWHRHIIGKSGSNVNRIKNECGTSSIQIPSDNEKSDIIRIEGSPQAVAAAKKEIMQMVNKMENEKSRDIIIEQRFHGNIIGSKGEKIREVREKLNEVQISFPVSGANSDIVTIRGPKDDVDKAYAHLKKMAVEIAAANYRVEVPIIKKFHRNVIGKGGNIIKKIKEETGTNIEIPTENSDSDVIVITGFKQQAEKARNMILDILNSIVNLKTAEITIPHKVHMSIIGSKGRLIRSIMEECGDVLIHFPPEGSNSDIVTIKGAAENVDKAKAQLSELANEKLIHSYSDEIRAKPEYHKFLIGRSGIHIKKIREETGAHIMFPSAKDTEKDLITIVGKKESVEKAKIELLAKITELSNIVEGEVDVDPKYHRHFIAHRAQVLHEISNEFGGVTVSFPRTGSDLGKVTLKGAKDCIEGAKQKILDIVADLEAMVSIDCVIAQEHHRAIMGPKGSHVQDVTSRLNVNIKFPERNTAKATNGEAPPVNGDDVVEVEETQRKCDVIVISGKQENVELAKEELLALVPISKEINIPFDMHRFIIGNKGSNVRELMNKHDVNIKIPPSDDKSDVVVVSGAPACVDDALEALQQKMQSIEEENEERKLRSFQLTVDVPSKHRPKIIGKKGIVIQKLRATHDVLIQVPPPDTEEGQASESNTIVLTGHEKNCHAAKEAILDIVRQLEDQVSMEVSLDPRIHSRIIGQKGRSVKKIMETYNVDIRFPRTGEDPSIIEVTGLEDRVEDCKEHLLMLQEEYMEDVNERSQTRDLMSQYMAPPSRSDGHDPKQADSGFVVRGAPWGQDIPDTTNTSDFPTLGPQTTNGGSGGQGKAWGSWSGRH